MHERCLNTIPQVLSCHSLTQTVVPKMQDGCNTTGEHMHTPDTTGHQGLRVPDARTTENGFPVLTGNASLTYSAMKQRFLSEGFYIVWLPKCRVVNRRNKKEWKKVPLLTCKTVGTLKDCPDVGNLHLLLHSLQGVLRGSTCLLY